MQAEGAGPVEEAAAFNPRRARERILGRQPFHRDRLRRYALMPFDYRWAYHTNERSVWNRPRPEFGAQIRDGSLFIVSRMMAERPQEGVPIIATRVLADYHLLRLNIQAIPVRLFGSDGPQGDILNSVPASRANLSASARAWLTTLAWPDPDADVEAGAAPWLHALAIACAPAWLDENRAAVLAGWPRIPLPTDAEALRISAGLGARLAELLDPDWPVPGVSAGSLTPPFGILGAVTRAGGGTLAPSELAVTASWGHGGHGRPVMPGQGRLTERSAYTADEMIELDRAATARGEAAGDLAARLGPPVDVWLNDIAYWRTVPRSVWDFTIGGYQVFKKWLSYREQDVLGRSMTTAEAREATGIIRRLAALVVCSPNSTQAMAPSATQLSPGRARPRQQAASETLAIIVHSSIAHGSTGRHVSFQNRIAQAISASRGDRSLRQAIENTEQGLIDADLERDY